MKTIYIIGGTMGVGKTTICQQLKTELNNSVFLDGDWCWDSSPFYVIDETKEMVIDNICHILNNFINCSVYENIIFCWVMHTQNIIDSILEKLDTNNCTIKNISLLVDKANLTNRITSDISSGIRSHEVLEKSISRIPLYESLNTIKIDTNSKSIKTIVDEIKML